MSAEYIKIRCKKVERIITRVKTQKLSSSLLCNHSRRLEQQSRNVFCVFGRPSTSFMEQFDERKEPRFFLFLSTFCRTWFQLVGEGRR